MCVFGAGQLASWTGGAWLHGEPRSVKGFSADSRTLLPGEAFIALRTERRDGHDFLPAARDKGAAAALVARVRPDLPLPQLRVSDPLAAFQQVALCHRREFAGPVIGVTGSCGKTSTKELLALLLGRQRTLATEGNLNNHLGVPITLTRLDARHYSAAVIEAGIDRPGEMDVLARMIAPSHAVVTLVAPAHLERMGDLATVAREKAVLARSVPGGGVVAMPESVWRRDPFQDLAAGTLVAVPGASPRGRSGVRFTSFEVTHRPDASRVSLCEEGTPARSFTLPGMSDGMAQNAVLAVLLASALGVSDDRISRVLPLWRPSRWRGEIKRVGRAVYYMDCYNANPASMNDALQAFVRLAPAGERRIFLLGCMEELGRTAADYHVALGRSLPLGERDRAILVGGLAGDLRAGVLAAGHRSDQAEILGDPGDLAAMLRGFEGAVFVKGSRRHRLEALLAGIFAAAQEEPAC